MEEEVVVRWPLRSNLHPRRRKSAAWAAVRWPSSAVEEGKRVCKRRVVVVVGTEDSRVVVLEVAGPIQVGAVALADP